MTGLTLPASMSRELPKRADLVYTYRPLDELPDILAIAKSVGAKAIWLQSGATAAARETSADAGSLPMTRPGPARSWKEPASA